MLQTANSALAPPSPRINSALFWTRSLALILALTACGRAQAPNRGLELPASNADKHAGEAGNQHKKKAAAIEFSVPAGYLEAPISLELRSPIEGGQIRYTLDGSEPSSKSAEYRAPLIISNTVPLRAAVFNQGVPASAVRTRSYIFLDQVIHQPSRPPGFPARQLPGGIPPATCEMNRAVTDHPHYRNQMKAALRALPIVSLVFQPADFFSARSGIYVNPMERGEPWERPCSVEFLPNDRQPAFQIDCGIRVQGNQNRVPEKSPKHSFRLLFKEKYGASKLDYQVFPDSPVHKFNTLVLRADFNDSWIHWDPSGQIHGQRTRDAWLKDSQRAMGWPSGHNRYVHLYLNGLYWGVYDIAERPDASFAAAYLGGDRKEYDVVNEGQVKDGTEQRFQSLQSLDRLSDSAQYRKASELLNVTQFIDYLLLNYYAGNVDWGEYKNWYAIARREPPEPFQYLVWDGERILEELNEDVVNSAEQTPFRLARALRANPEFRAAFAARAQKHLTGDGALTPKASADRWMKRAAEVDLAIIAESARWGGYRRRVPYTRDAEWLREQRRLLEEYFPQRTAVVLAQLRAAGLCQ